MKRIILTLTFSISFGLLSFAQKIANADVPVSVMIGYKSKFTGGTVAEKDNWEIDYDNYRVNFKWNKIDYSALFDKTGKWLNTESPVSASALPKEIKNSLKEEFSGYEVKYPKKLESEKETTYNMGLVKGELAYHIVITEKGEILFKTEGLEEDDTDENE
jgi:hypothetical protein